MTRSALLSRVLAGVALTLATAQRTASADEPPPAERPVDVVIHEAPPPHRTLSIEWNPLSLLIDRFSLNAVIVPGDHHALVLSPFYTWANTAEWSTGLNADGTPLSDTTGKITGTQGAPYVLNVPQQWFTGFGAEIGYRYYFRQGGPRGLFVGPSLILDAMTAQAYNGSKTSYFGYGLAADVGYEVLIVDKWAASVGAGLQYTRASQDLPSQQLPASIVANDRLYPRMLLSLGYAL